MIYYKLTFVDNKKTRSYIDLPFENDSQVLGFITDFNITMDSVEIIDCKKTVFEKKAKILTLPKKSYKMLFEKNGLIPDRKVFYGDTDMKVKNILKEHGFNVTQLLRENSIEL